MNKPKVYYVHVNQHKQKWTVHGTAGCKFVDRVHIDVPTETVHKPNKKENPRWFVRCRGVLTLHPQADGTTVAMIS